MALDVWEHSGVWACHVTRKVAMQESDCLDQWFWHGPVCFLEPVHRWTNTWYHVGKSEEFCKPQLNEVRARFDLFTSFWQGNRSVDEWYNAVQTQAALAKYPPQKQLRSFTGSSFGFSLKDEEFVSKTINDSNIDLDKFPASKVR